MSRTYKDIPQRVFYKQKTGKDKEIVTNSKTTIGDISEIIDNYSVSVFNCQQLWEILRTNKNYVIIVTTKQKERQ